MRAGRERALLAASILFAPTGPVQEPALRSGWGNAFLVLARRFDAAADPMHAVRAK